MTASSAAKNLVWWEKSVEYTFVAEMVKLDRFTWVVPMGGNQESALADALVQCDGKLLLIEFKRDVNSLDSEHEKYAVEKNAEIRYFAYETAKAKMCLHKAVSGHGLIFGKLNAAKLELRAKPYWDTVDSVEALSWCEGNGVSVADFDDYLTELSGFRFAKSDTSDGSTGSRSFVVAVGKSGQGFAVELEDYVNLRPGLKLKLELKLKRRPDSIPRKSTSFSP